MGKNGKKKKTVKLMLLIIILLIVSIIALLLIEYCPQLQKAFFSKPKLYLVEDRCGLMLNRLVHTIKDEGYCRESCRNECIIRKEKFHDSEFIEKENSCHTCNCYCV